MSNIIFDTQHASNGNNIFDTQQDSGSSGNISVTPNAGSIVITGYAPTVTQTGQQSSGGLWLGAYEYVHRRKRKNDEEKEEVQPQAVEQKDFQPLLAQRLEKAIQIESEKLAKEAQRKKAEYQAIERKASQAFISKLKEQQSKAQKLEAIQRELDSIEQQRIELKAELKRLEDEEEEEISLLLLM